MLTSRTIKFIAFFIALLIIGLILGNRIIIFLSLMPLAFALIGLITVPPDNIKLISQQIVARAWVGEIIEVKYEISVGSGLGAFTLHQFIPPYFALTEGNNLRVYWKNWRPQNYIFSYKLRCTKRGVYSLSQVQWESTHLFRFIPTREGQLGEISELTVNPRLLNVRRIRGIPGIATSPFPVIDIAKIGVQTTDFREIRRYVHGDPIKSINWKATARNPNPDGWPLTNEYEVEGKKAIWVFMDSSKVLEVGTDVINVFEYCLEAANGVMYYFLDRGYRVGMYAFNGVDRLFYPDSGKKQYLKISREMIDVQPGNKVDEFPRAVERCRHYILGYNPLCIIITRLDTRFSESIVTGVKKLCQLRGRRTRKLPIMIINIPGYNIVATNEGYDESTSVLMQLGVRPRVQQLRRLGTSVMDWNPKKETFGTALLKMVKTQ